VTVIQASLAIGTPEVLHRDRLGRRALAASSHVRIFRAMVADTGELALRYLLELSADIRVAFLASDGEILAAAPDPPSERARSAASALVREVEAVAARGERGSSAGSDVELDLTVEGGAVFVVREGGLALVCVTGPFALAGLILHDMRIALGDIRRGSKAVDTAEAGEEANA
jgi:hypothetical protein